MRSLQGGMRMSLQQVKIACLQFDHTMPLFEGAVKIEGVDAAFETASIPSDIVEKMIRATTRST